MTGPKAVLDEAIEAFRRLKSCCQQSKEAEEDASALYTEAKTFQATAESWFTDLEALYAAAKNDFERKKYRALYAYYLEACQVWAKIEDLSSVPQDPEWLRQKLVAELKNVLITKDEHFLWHDCWLKMQLAVTTAQASYDDYKTNRRKNFVLEAEDVTAEISGYTPYGREESDSAS